MGEATREWVAEVDRRLREVFGVPRRRGRDPVGQLVATMLSQATTDTQTGRSYDRLRARWPTWEAVRDAPVPAIEREIRASGLSRQKAPRIKGALKDITAERGRLELDFLNELPLEDAYHWLLQIHGVGPKTASIVLLFTFARPVFPVDTHIHRIARRLGWIPPKASAERAHELLKPLIPRGGGYRLHVNLIRHGREICIARLPRCEVCPLTDVCDYYAHVRETGLKQSTPLGHKQSKR